MWISETFSAPPSGSLLDEGNQRNPPAARAGPQAAARRLGPLGMASSARAADNVAWCDEACPLRQREPFPVQVLRMEELKARDPDRARRIMAGGEAVVDAFRRGSLEEAARLLRATPEEEILVWHTVRMARAAAAGGHARALESCARWGLDLSLPPLKHLLHELAAAGGGTEGDMPACIAALVAAGADVNAARPGDWHTPLHVACRGASLPLAAALVRHGADVNAVGDQDAMPLPLAREAGADALAAMLEARGARVTWRRGPSAAGPLRKSSAASGGAADASSTVVSHRTGSDAPAAGSAHAEAAGDPLCFSTEDYE